MDQDVIAEYVKKARGENVSDVDIRQSLMNAGWQQDVVDNAMSAVSDSHSRQWRKGILISGTLVGIAILGFGAFAYMKSDRNSPATDIQTFAESTNATSDTTTSIQTIPSDGTLFVPISPCPGLELPLPKVPYGFSSIEPYKRFINGFRDDIGNFLSSFCPFPTTVSWTDKDTDFGYLLPFGEEHPVFSFSFNLHSQEIPFTPDLATKHLYSDDVEAIITDIKKNLLAHDWREDRFPSQGVMWRDYTFRKNFKGEEQIIHLRATTNSVSDPDSYPPTCPCVSKVIVSAGVVLPYDSQKNPAPPQGFFE